MLKSAKVVLFLVGYLAFCVEVAVNGAPMDQNKNTHIHPSFGEPDPYHLVAPVPTPSYEEHDWNYLPYQEYPQSSYHHQGPSNESPFETAPMWNQEYLNTQQFQDYHGLSPPLPPPHHHQLFDNEQFINSFDQGMHLNNPYTFDQSAYFLPPRTHDGQASGSQHPHSPTYLPLTPPASPPRANSPLPSTRKEAINPARRQLARDELETRSDKLNLQDWQKTYHEEELLDMYRKIADKWGNLKTFTYTKIVFPRLNDEFEKDPIQRELVLANDPIAIDNVARAAGLRAQNDRARENEGMWTPQDFINWIRRSKYERKSVTTGASLPHWAALWGKHQSKVTKVFNRLVKAWGTTKEEVNRRLELVTAMEMMPFLPRLAAQHFEDAEPAATELLELIEQKPGYHFPVPQTATPSSYHDFQEPIPDDNGELYYALQNQFLQSPPRSTYNPYDLPWYQ